MDRDRDRERDSQRNILNTYAYCLLIRRVEYIMIDKGSRVYNYRQGYLITNRGWGILQRQGRGSPEETRKCRGLRSATTEVGDRLRMGRW